MGESKLRTTIGRSRGVRGPDAIELAFAGMVVVSVAAIAVGFGIDLIKATQTLDAVSLASDTQVDVAVYYAVHGRWPSPGNRDIGVARESGIYLEHLALDHDGVVTAELTLGRAEGALAGDRARAPGGTHGFVSFRPELLGSRDAPSILLLCGYAEPVAGAIAAPAANRTTLPRTYLPPFCR